MSINLINYALAQKDWKKAYDDLKVLEIGGRNLLPNTRDWNGWTANNGNAYKTSNTYEGCVIQEQKTNWAYLRITSQKQLIPGKTYTASVWLKASVGGILIPYYTHESNPNGSARILDMQSIDGDTKVTTEWKRWYVTFVANGTNQSAGARVEARGFGTSGVILYVAGLKLEEGNRPTTWTPAPEDINAHPFVAELAETVFRSKQNEERIRILENAITALGGGS